MITKSLLRSLARKHGTPLFIVDHEALCLNFRDFRRFLPRVQPYYAVKANPLPEIVRTLYEAGASFDVASIAEFRVVHANIAKIPSAERQRWIWDKIIYANPIKDEATLRELNRYRPLVTFDNEEEIRKIKRYAPQAGLALRIRVPNTGSMVELSSKFGASPGEAVALIIKAQRAGLTVEGLAFHVGSQCTNFQNYMQALDIAASLFKEARARGYDKMNLLDIGGGFPAPYDENVRPFVELARALNAEIDRLFPPHIQIIAEPGRFIVATAATAVSRIIGKARRDGKLCYYIDDGVYHTYSGVIFDHCKYRVEALRRGPREICSVFGPTCDALDTVSLAEELPNNLKLGDLVYSRNIGAYSHASSTYFNGFPPAKVVHIRLRQSRR